MDEQLKELIIENDELQRQIEMKWTLESIKGMMSG